MPNVFRSTQNQTSTRQPQTILQNIDQANQLYILPDEGSDIHFKNVRYMQECPVVIYADFECTTAPIDDKANAKNFYQEHRPTSYAYKVVFRSGIPDSEKLDKLQLYHGPNAAEKFLDALEEIEPELIEFLTRRWR